jgi:hypothetical protein
VKLFYVVYVRDHRLGPALATIRLLANPAAKWLPHITVAGPFAEEQDLSIQSSRVGGMPVEITGVATDFGSNRDIGALLVHAPRLEAIRYQPDFPGGSLHISICRGSIRHEVMPGRGTSPPRLPSPMSGSGPPSESPSPWLR